MRSKLLFATAGLAVLFGTSAVWADSVVITKEQAPEVQQYIVKQHVEPVAPPSDLDAQVGAVVPDSVVSEFDGAYQHRPHMPASQKRRRSG